VSTPLRVTVLLQECGGEPPLIELRPPECEPGLVPGATHNGAKGAGGSIRPFDEKHALQQASIVGKRCPSVLAGGRQQAAAAKQQELW
jgi:hypothetical protein